MHEIENPICRTCRTALTFKRIIPCAANYDIWSYACSECATTVFNMVGANHPSVDERRSIARHAVAEAAIIELRSSDLPCMVRNVSASGACLSLAGRPRLPKNFTLMAFGRPTPCRTVWRSENQLGVVFR